MAKKEARSEELESPTFWSVARCSIQLSYERVFVRVVFGCSAYGIRTRVTGVRGRRPGPLDERAMSCYEGAKIYKLPD
jgi:hypothetical protein